MVLLKANAWEWVADWYSPGTYASRTSAKSVMIYPGWPKQDTKKVRRVGSYHCPPHCIRSAYRAADNPEKVYSVLGFRHIAEKK